MDFYCIIEHDSGETEAEVKNKCAENLNCSNQVMTIMYYSRIIAK